MLTELIIILGLLNTTLLICFKKWKWLEWYEIHRARFMPSSQCYLCLGFWMSTVEILASFLVTLNPWLLLVPFCSAAITNYLTNVAIIHAYNKN